MSLSIQTPSVSYVGDSFVTEFVGTFTIKATVELFVYLDGILQVAGYTVTAFGDTLDTCVVEFAVAPGTGVVVRLDRDTPLEQTTILTPGADLSSVIIEKKYDELTRMIQDVDHRAGLADDLSIIITAADDQDFIMFDAASGDWIDRTPAQVGQVLADALLDTLYQPLDDGLTDIAALAVTDGNIIVGDGFNWVAESGVNARDSLGLTIGSDVQAWDADLDAVAALGSTGFATRTAANTWAQRSLTAPAAGFTITNPAGVAGNPTFVLATDLAALEGLGSTGIAVRTGANTWAQRTITIGAGLSVTNPGGVAGNILIQLDDDVEAVEALTTTGIVRRTATNVWSAGTTVAIAEGGTGEITASAAINALVPDQTGNSGKFLSTNGTVVAWEAGVTDHGALTGLTDDDHTQYLLADGTRGLSADWDAGSFEIRAQTFESDVVTGTAPFVIASTTVVTNLNADLLDGQHAAAFQPIDAGLTDIAGLAVTDGNIIVGDGANWVAESGATARTSLGLAIGTDVQAFDAELTAIAALAGTGLIAHTGAGTVAERTITGTASQITMSNGDGVAGDPTIAIATDPVLPGTGAVTVPTGTDAQQPGSPVVGMLRYNTDDDAFEGYSGAVPAWASLGGGGSSPLTTKGDLYTFSTVDARLGVGNNDEVLIADSAQTTGLRWGVAGSVSETAALYMWGTDNTFSGASDARGLGGTRGIKAPVPMSLGGGWANAAKGNIHTVAVKTDGTLWTWGDGSAGQLGNGTTAGGTFIPIKIGTDTDWSIVTGLGGANAAVKTDGTLWTWGQNNEGEGGHGDNNGRSSPTQVGAGTDWETVSGGVAHNIAVKTDGTLWTWGWNGDGQLGLGDITNRNSPVQVGAGTDWAYVSSGYNFSAAIKTDGTLWTWGWNDGGPLGLGDIDKRSSPVQVGTGTDWASVSMGQDHALAIKTDGTLWAWGGGQNLVGQVGDGALAGRSSPVQIGAGTDWSAISAGNYTSSAIKTGGTLWAWGDNAGCQFGDSTSIRQSSPIQIGSATTWTKVTQGHMSGAHSGAIR